MVTSEAPAEIANRTHIDVEGLSVLRSEHALKP